jgi:hypothetical protein
VGATSVTATYFTGATFSGGTFYGTHTGVASLTSGTFTGTSVGATSVTATYFTGATFSGGTFYGAAALTSGTFTGTSVGATSVTATYFTGAAFTGGSTTAAVFYATGNIYASNAITVNNVIATGNLFGYHIGTFSGSTFTGGTFYGSTVSSTGDVIAYASDDRLKTRLGNIPSAIEKVKSLNGFIFTWNDVANSYGYSDLEQHVGLSAQEIKAVLPQVIRPAPFDGGKTGNNYMTVQYEKVVPLLVEAIKEQAKQIEELRALCATVLSRQ